MTHTPNRSTRVSARKATGTVATPPDGGFRPLGTYFVEAGLLSPAQVQVVLNDQALTGLRFGEILVQRGWMKETTIEYFVHKLIEPERRSLQKSMAWQKGSAGQRSAHRKGFVGAPAAPPPSMHRKVVPMPSHEQSAPLRPAAHHRKGFVAQGKSSPQPDAPASASPQETDQEVTTCTGVSRGSNYEEVSENLVWIG